MKLARKLTFWLLVGVCGVFAVDTYLSGRLYRELFERDMRRDHVVLGRALAMALGAAWRDHGEAYARALLGEANERESRVRIDWIPAALPAEGSAPEAVEGGVGSAVTETHLERDAGSEPRFYTYVPVAIEGRSLGTLELSESLAETRQYFRSRSYLKLTSAAAFLGLWGLMAWFAGVKLVGRPTRSLVDKARRIGAGDFSGPLKLPQRDELSQLADEMNTMADQLARARDGLRAETAARLEALDQLRHAERLTTVGKLAAGIAHELGTPLNVVAGRAQMIARGETADASETAQLAGIIIQQTARMTSIVRHLLDFARQRTPDRRPSDLVSLVRDTTALLGPLAKGRGVGVEFGCRLESLECDVDAFQLQQALTNLVVNAVQASKPRAIVTIGLTLESAAASEDGAPDCACILVRDDGEGIPKDVLSRIFDPFFTSKSVGEGTGLGLSVAYGIVKDHGGWIDVDSEPGHGSRFRIFLPLGA
jgi:two-component system, NtrC family, sensor kinase